MQYVRDLSQIDSLTDDDEDDDDEDDDDGSESNYSKTYISNDDVSVDNNEFEALPPKKQKK